MNFIENKFNKEGAAAAADYIDTNNNQDIEKQEILDALKSKNSELSEEIKKIVQKVVGNLEENGLYEKEDFIQALLTEQELEKYAVTKTYEAKKEATNEVITTATSNLEVKANATKDVVDETAKLKNEMKKEETSEVNEVVSYNFTKTLRRGSRFTKDVKALQAIVGTNPDGQFGPATDRAVKKWQKDNNLVADGIVGKNSRKVLNNGKIVTKKSVIEESQKDNSPIEKTDDYKNVKNKADEYSKSLDETKELLGVSKELQKAVNDIVENNAEGHHLLKGIKELIGANKTENIIAKATGIEKMLNVGINRDKLIRALAVLGINEKIGTEMRDGEEVGGLNNPALNTTLRHIKKALPWVVGIYLCDLPIPMTMKLVPNLDLSKSLALTKWIEGGMQGELTYTDKDKAYGKNAVEKAFDLRGELTRFTGSKEVQKILSKDISVLKDKEIEVLNLFFKNILLPQLKVANKDSFHGGLFNWLADSVFSNDAEENDKVLADLEKSLENGELNMDLVRLTIKGLRIEDELSSKQIVDSIDNKVNYFDEIFKNNKLLKKIEGLLEIGESNMNILYKFKNKESFINAYGLEDFSTAIDKVHSMIETGNMDGISNLPKEVKELFSAIGTKQLGEYKAKFLKAIPGVKEVNKGNHKYGMDLRKLDSKESYEALSKNGVEGNGLNSVQTLFKGLVNYQGLDNIGFSEFDAALQNLSDISIDKMKGDVLNTSRKGIASSELTKFENALGKNDTHVKHTSIEKTFTYYEDGQIVTEKVRYNIYMRPECSNLLIVPDSISSTKVASKNPELDVNMYSGIPYTIPVVIPYNAFGGGKSGGGTNKPSGNTTTPGVDRGSDIGGGVGTPVSGVTTGR